MNLLDLILPFNPPPTGCLEVSADWVASLPKHELFAGGPDRPTIDWTALAPPFRYQEASMMCTAFAMCSVGSMLEKKETGQSVLFSPLELFIRSGGSVEGNYIQAASDSAKDGLAREVDVPWIGPLSEWNPLILKLLQGYVKATGKVLEGQFATKGLTSVATDWNSIDQALKDSPLIGIVNVGRGYFDPMAAPSTNGARHAVVIEKTGINGSIQVFDSLEDRAGFDGHHWLPAGFPILYAFGVLDLPDDWQKQQADKTHSPAGNGPKEQAALSALMAARSKNPTVASFIDRDLNLLVEAVAWHGFSVQDVLNNYTSVRRGKGPIFDFSQNRR